MSEQKSDYQYPPPLDQLLRYGDEYLDDHWEILLNNGITEAHIPDLIRMATDPELNWADSESGEVWASLYAWRLLGVLRAEAAIEPLLNLLTEFDKKGNLDLASEEIPEVLTRIGSAAVPATRAYLLSGLNPLYPRIDAATALAMIGERYPEARPECVAVLTEALERFEENDEDLNGFLIGDLVDLKAVEAAPVIQRAFEAFTVNGSIAGSLNDVMVELGLREPDPNRKLPKSLASPDVDSSEFSPDIFNPTIANAGKTLKKAKSKEKAKRKQAKQSRKTNRKRK